MIIAWIPLLKYRINEICCGARLPGCSAGKLRVPWLYGLKIDVNGHQSLYRAYFIKIYTPSEPITQRTKLPLAHVFMVQ